MTKPFRRAKTREERLENKRRFYRKNIRKLALWQIRYNWRIYFGSENAVFAVYRRDKYRCVKCGLRNSEHKRRWGRKLSIDHIDGSGGSKRPNNSMSNLQTLCMKCHGRKDNKLRILQESDIPRIRSLRRAGIPLKEVAKEFRVTDKCISDVMCGVSWQVGLFLTPPPTRPRFESVED